MIDDRFPRLIPDPPLDPNFDPMSLRIDNPVRSMNMQQRFVGDVTIPQMLGIGLRLWRRRNEVFALARQAQDLLAEIMGPQGRSPAAHPFDVKWVQSSLNTLQKAGLTVDGDYGERTRAAVKQFQSANKLEPDGWVGMLTLSALEEKMIPHST
jgi:hypothetical protein